MTTILYGFTKETEHGNILLIERYADKYSVPMWRIICNGRVLKDFMYSKPRKSCIERYEGIADANFPHKR